ncbi:MAG: hypothetical protein HC906_07115 [Bacteroidales bacterium]|nr:hypothetical protein [Bacteroidales bacterium]
MINRLTKIKTVGLCHGVYGGPDQVSHMLDMPYEDVEYRACGLNHIVFMSSLRDRKTGEDLYPKVKTVDWDADPLADWQR